MRELAGGRLLAELLLHLLLGQLRLIYNCCRVKSCLVTAATTFNSTYLATQKTVNVIHCK